MNDLCLSGVKLLVESQQLSRGVNFSTLTHEQKLAYASDCAHALMREGAELADSFPSLPWKTSPVDAENAKREIVDIIFFICIIMACLDISTEDVAAKFEWVLLNNYERIKSGEHRFPIRFGLETSS